MQSKQTRWIMILCVGLVAISVTPELLAKEDAVIILQSGERIAAKITEISDQIIRFEAKNKQQAFKYGTEIGVGEIKGIETSEGEVLSVEHYQAYRENRSYHAKPERSRPRVERVETPDTRVQAPKVRERQTVASQGQLQEFVDSLMEAGLASAYLGYLNTSGKSLSRTEVEIKRIIENSPEWRDKLDELRYIDEIAFESLSRAFYYKPDELKSELNLNFDEDAKMNFPDLMAQLHDRLGSRVSQSDFSTLVEIVGKGGARAIRDILKNYSSWKFATSER